MSYTISQLTPKGGALGASDILEIETPIGGGLYQTKSVTGQEIKDFIGGLGGENYVFVNSDGTTDENGLAFFNAYQSAKTLTPNGAAISATNQVTLVLAPGIYTYGTSGSSVILDTQYINITSLTSQPDVIIDSSGVSLDTLLVGANNVKVTGIKTSNSIIVVTDSGSTFTNCIGGDESFGSPLLATSIQGTYVNCSAGHNSFGCFSSGIFINCLAGMNSFGGETNFGFSGNASGYFKDCSALGDGCFGGSIFADITATASGTFLNCSANNYSFGYGTFSGVAYNCRSLEYCFGSLANNGSVYNSVSGVNSFVINNGFLFYSKITSGTFTPPSGTGKIRLCIDGSNNIQNLG